MTISARLDTRPDRIDLRDRQYQPPLRAIESVYPRPEILGQAVTLYLKHEMVLDQGTEGACTGFGLGSVINALLWRRAVLKVEVGSGVSLRADAEPPEKVSPRMLYHLARFYDEWPGEDYEGSSCRGALKAWFKHGVCREELWPYRNPKTKRAEFVAPSEGWEEDAASRPLGIYYRIEKGSIRDMQAAIQEVGAVYCSAKVHDGWTIPKLPGKKALRHANLPVIGWDLPMEHIGGHAFALVGYSPHGFVLQNSWGPGWGLSGFAILTYDDWLANGTDAWVTVMGAPIRRWVPRNFVPGDLGETTFDQAVGRAAFVSRRRAPELEDKGRWTLEDAYLHSVVMANDGKVLNRLVAQANGQAAVGHVVIERAKAFFAKHGGTPKIAIYAHGGLNNEGDSLERIRKLGPYFQDNGIYPVFFTWKTGLLESLYGILEDSAKRLFPQSGGLKDILDSAGEYFEDALDRTIEVAAENLGIKAIWSQMKQNAGAASMRENRDRGVFLTTLALFELKEALPNLEIHLVGHSAGSILLGHMLDDFPRNQLQVKTCTLYAPACSIDFAVRHYQKAVERSGILSLEDTHIHLLDDRRERDDTVGPYRKSLLYLVSRALESSHKTPLLGLENAFDAVKAQRGGDYNHWHPSTLSGLRKWQEFWGGNPIYPVQTDQVPTRAVWQKGKIKTVEKQIDAAHGAFDNDVSVVAETIRRITGQQQEKKPVTDLEY